MTKTLFLDIEASNLDADFGQVLCVGFKSLGGPMHCPSIHDYPSKKGASFAESDFPLVRDLYKIICDADLIVTYYGKLFDWPFLQARMLLAGLPPLPPLATQHLDLYWTVKSNFKISRRRLETVSEWLGCPYPKTPLNGPIWVEARAGNQKAMKYVIDHCKQDIKILEWVYEKLKPYIRQHPLVGAAGKCASCGSSRLQRRGLSMATSSLKPRQRVQCQDCGRWSLVKID